MPEITKVGYLSPTHASMQRKSPPLAKKPTNINPPVASLTSTQKVTPAKVAKIPTSNVTSTALEKMPSSPGKQKRSELLTADMPSAKKIKKSPYEIWYALLNELRQFKNRPLEATTKCLENLEQIEKYFEGTPSVYKQIMLIKKGLNFFNSSNYKECEKIHSFYEKLRKDFQSSNLDDKSFAVINGIAIDYASFKQEIVDFYAAQFAKLQVGSEDFEKQLAQFNQQHSFEKFDSNWQSIISKVTFNAELKTGMSQRPTIKF